MLFLSGIVRGGTTVVWGFLVLQTNELIADFRHFCSISRALSKWKLGCFELSALADKAPLHSNPLHRFPLPKALLSFQQGVG